MRLDSFLPAYDFRELHEVLVRASASRIYRAIKVMKPADLPVMALLLVIRSLPGRIIGGGSMALACENSVLEQFINAGFLLLAEEQDHEIVVGRISQFWKLIGAESPRIGDSQEFVAFARPGFVKVAVNFRIEERKDGAGKLSTETRIAATDLVARWKFGAYWPLFIQAAH